MQIVIELPDDIADRLQLQPANLPHRILELIAADTTIVKTTLAQQKFAECLTFHPVGKPMHF